ncbi:MAG: hypothetical protein K2X94_03905 [Amoebophilaceae bacterium]|nr:hypothetical protein [Amoebophilaceae bacterium]
MHTILLLLSIFIGMGIQTQANRMVVSCDQEKIILLAAGLVTENDDEATNNNKPTESLDEILKIDVNSEGVLNNILGGLALVCNALANILLYPIFSFLLVLLSLGLVVLGGFLIKKIKEEQFISGRWIIASSLYLLFYFDLFLVVFQKNKILLLFLELEKDLVLLIVSSVTGYTIGKYFSNRSFEEKKLP